MLLEYGVVGIFIAAKKVFNFWSAIAYPVHFQSYLNFQTIALFKSRDLRVKFSISWHRLLCLSIDRCLCWLFLSTILNLTFSLMIIVFFLSFRGNVLKILSHQHHVSRSGSILGSVVCYHEKWANDFVKRGHHDFSVYLFKNMSNYFF